MRILGFFVPFMIMVFVARAQQNAEDVKSRFDAYHSLWRNARIHLVLNQPKFSPGDTVWFKAYFRYDDLSPVKGRQIIHVNLVNSRGDITSAVNCAILNGAGSNQLMIPSNATAGLYNVTAHSTWMLNFEPPPVFKEEISIVDEKPIEVAQKKWVIAAPEGGRLNEGVENKIAVWSNQPNGMVEILDETGITVVRGRLDSLGTVILYLRPTRQKYILKSLTEGNPITLPEVTMSDFHLSVTPAFTHNDSVRIYLKTTREVERPEPLTLVVSSRGRIHFLKTLQSSFDSLCYTLPQTSLQEGVVDVSLLGDNNELRLYRKFFSLGREHPRVVLQSGKSNYNRRDTVELIVSIADHNGKSMHGEFSLKVLNSGLFDKSGDAWFYDNVRAGSEFSDWLTMNNVDHTSLVNVDRYLIAAGKPLSWSDILNYQHKPGFRFTTAIERSGRAYFADTGKPLPDYSQVLIYLQKDMMVYQTFTLDSGKLSLGLPDIYGDDEFFYVAETPRGEQVRNVKIKWDGRDVRLSQARPAEIKSGIDTYGSFSRKLKMISKAFDNVLPEAMVEEIASSAFEDEIQGADITVMPEDYLSFSTMEELIKEVVPALYTRKQQGRSVVGVNLDIPVTTKGEPVYIIDGIATSNTDFFLSLKPSNVVSIKIVKNRQKLAPFKLLGKYGIVIVQTKSGNKREPVSNGNLISGLSKPMTFRTPDHRKMPAWMPDFRTTIYWQPTARTDAEGKAIVRFVCSDDIGKMAIRIEGITDDGHFFTGTHEVEVTDH